MSFKVVEIFTSIEGEGARAGLPSLFIRLHGCNLSCSYCDSQYACVGTDYKEMTCGDIIAAALVAGLRTVTLTGGEPLMHEGVLELLEALDDSNFHVNVETNGSLPIEPYMHLEKVMFTVDYKCPSSDMNEAMLRETFKSVRATDVIKFVVGSREDLSVMRNFIDYMNPEAQVYVSPVWGKIEPKHIVEYVLQNKLHRVRVQLQLHKIIWPVEQRGV